MDSTKKLDKKTLSKSFNLWFWGALTCFSQEHMQTFGYMASMLPILKKLYPKHEDQVNAIHAYTAFFNTNPMLGSVIVGITASMEEARANGKGIDGETINDMRAGLMGPIAGIGDSLIDGTLIPILLGIALGMSSGGSPVGAIFYIVVWVLLAYFGQRFLYFRGYKLGDKAVEFLVGEQGAAVRRAIGTVGAMVVGGVLASWVNVTTSLKLYNSNGKVFLNLQNQLDSIFPGLLTVLITIFCWWLMSKKHVSAIWTMLILVAISFVGVLVGFFNPGLSY
ncbi:PTS family mannose/fructose/sorbose porter component IID [Lactobacillus equicursoris DSM 19284 = JCM 14600 = CIP 110162]|uniref:PTS system mannose fructose N-acetylgalactosamine-specific transporter subunit IID n=1 Tax=Lactobacillus equicursoris DSM 19284 = JCM 14600 = CIP 110162 TaxID=1293597 RepID=K0NKI8_9LACO|nr:PTS system mannose/fructose/sorbose family transporter subunit IID [Lactobacillus equicursoris]KRL00362.1 PTS system mannose fructose N-acetylgalactosamine-specific transporter subunit IID [Lactobacillus equicursoris DSM 19284 = JCM 14600 = CIP 110162]MDD6385765.1 PTS system mannose/fructose/sorbose family transporter subunit IID [Lactobacillus equicursoris]MDD6406662.1 PTS system mannose/fructose/sorbose family transporter subunit IID [Lactobacillus equicursoris]CCK85817.1 PTS family mannos